MKRTKAHHQKEMDQILQLAHVAHEAVYQLANDVPEGCYLHRHLLAIQGMTSGVYDGMSLLAAHVARHGYEDPVDIKA